MDSRPRKSKLFANKKGACKTGEIIDMVIAYHEVDLSKFKELMKQNVAELKYGFTPASTEHPYTRKMVTVKRKTRNKTYMSDEGT